MTLLLLIAIVWMFILLIPKSRPGIVRVHQKTAREEALHGQIQAAMNWRPEHFHLREDGKYRNAYGQEGVCMTLEEFMTRAGEGIVK